MEQGVSAARAATLLALALLAGCVELPLPPQVEPGGEPGPPVYSSVGQLESFTSAVVGRATYVLDDNGQAALSLSADFRVPDVPRMSIFLSNQPDVAEAVKVGELKAPTGAQRWTFRVPRGAVWRWAVIWSEEVRVGVARARLQ
jgi:hypothetical protein